MNSLPLVSVIVLNYNAGELLLNCIKSLKNSIYKNLEIIVVDNVSSDGSQMKCKEIFSDIKLIENKKNLGYCGGNNVGIKNAKGEFITILNPDTIVEANWVNELIVAYEKFGDGLYQPKILSLNEENIIQSTGNMLHVFGFGFARDKVKFTIRFKGRELQHVNIGNELMEKIKVDMENIGKIELQPKFDGKQMIMVVQPI